MRRVAGRKRVPVPYRFCRGGGGGVHGARSSANSCRRVPGATSLEDILPLMFLPGSLAAPPATAGATTGAVPVPTAAPTEPVRRSIAESSQHRRSVGAAFASRRPLNVFGRRRMAGHCARRLWRSRREAGGATSEPDHREWVPLSPSAVAPGPARRRALRHRSRTQCPAVRRQGARAAPRRRASANDESPSFRERVEDFRVHSAEPAVAHHQHVIAGLRAR